MSSKSSKRSPNAVKILIVNRITLNTIIMQRTYTKPADSKDSRPKTAGKVIIENLKKDGDVIGIEVGGEKWSVEKLCRHDESQYCENCPMHLAIELQRVDAYYVQCELMVYLESL